MKQCDRDCVAICDFCRLYNFNPKTIDGRGGLYDGNGYCVFHETPKDPTDTCNDFVCHNYKVLDGNRK